MPSTATAGGPNAVCSLNYYCVNKSTVTFGYTGTTMTYGWKHYPGNATSGVISSDVSWNSFSNGGGVVENNMKTIRNRNNITGRVMCLVAWQADVGDFLSKSASWYNEYWVNVTQGGYRAYWPNSTTSC